MKNGAFSYLMRCDLAELSNYLHKNARMGSAVKAMTKFFNKNCNFYSSSYIANLSDAELVRLVKVFTLIDKEYWPQGSVTAIPTLLNVLKERSETRFIQLVNWVIAVNDGHNPWLPFDNRSYANCKSYFEYKKLEAERKIAAAEGELDAELRRLQKLERLRVKANRNIWNAVRRRDTAAIKTLVAKGVDLDLKNTDGVTIADILRSRLHK